MMLVTDGMTIEEAIVAQACEDYSQAIRGKGRSPSRMLADTKRFFKSAWFRTLTDLDADYLINKLDEDWARGKRLIEAGEKIECPQTKTNYEFVCPVCGGRAIVRAYKNRGKILRSYQCEKCKIFEKFVPMSEVTEDEQD